VTTDAVGPLSHRRLLNIAVPVVLANITVPILGAVDTAVVGQMGQAAPIGAVGLGAVILTGLYWLFGFLRMGTTGLTSQAIGAGDRAEADALLTRALLVAFAAGGALIVLQWPLFAGAFLLAPASEEVEGLAREYMAIRVWSAPALIALYGITGWLIAAERTRAVLLIQVVMNGLNILLDLWFVLGLGWGVPGVAAATFLAEWSGFAVGLWFCRDAILRGHWKDWPRVFDAGRLRRMGTVNGDILVRSALLQVIFVSFLFVGGGLGDVTLAANHVLLQFLQFTAYAMDGFAFGAETLVGQAMGARRRAMLRRAAGLASLWGVGTGAALALAFALAGPAIVDVMTTAEPVRAAAREHLPWVVVSTAVGAAPFMLDGIFIGATRTRDMRNMMAVSAAIYAAAALLLVPVLGNHGLWAALVVSYVARGLTLWRRYPALEAEADRAAG
jgi:MATE family multidrug resistance protein